MQIFVKVSSFCQILHLISFDSIIPVFTAAAFACMLLLHVLLEFSL